MVRVLTIFFNEKEDDFLEFTDSKYTWEYMQWGIKILKKDGKAMWIIPYTSFEYSVEEDVPEVKA